MAAYSDIIFVFGKDGEASIISAPVPRRNIPIVPPSVPQQTLQAPPVLPPPAPPVFVPLSISPTSLSTTPKGHQTFTAANGSGGGYVYSFTTNHSGGTINSVSGAYGAGTTGSVTDTIKVTDSLSNVVSVSITVGAGVTVSPNTATVAPFATKSFSASGGTNTGFVFTLTTNHSGGSVNSSTGLYTAGSTGSVTDVVTATDSIGNVGTTTITVSSGVAISPTSVTLSPKGSQTFTGSGGSGGYAYSFVTNNSGGTINSSSGAYVAGATGSVTDTVKVTDSLSHTASATITVSAGVSISPSSVSIAPLATQTFTASGGSGTGFTYTMLVNNSGGSINSGSGLYTAGATPSVTDTIKATDSLTNTGTSTINVTSGGGGGGGTNPIGINFGAGDYSALSPEGFPIFQDRIREGRGFTQDNLSTYCTVNANGWPNGNFDTVSGSLGFTVTLADGNATQSWMTASGGLFKCGFTGNGAETVAGRSATVSNVVHSGANTTFDLTYTGSPLFGFRVGGVTGAVTNIFAYLPEYPASSYSATSLFTTEAVAHYSQYASIRFMDWSNTLFNEGANTSATMRTASSLKTQMNWFNTLKEGYPQAWAVDLCNACSANGWFHIPVVDDGTYASALATYLHANMNGNIYIELGNELWNGVGVGGSFWTNLATTYNSAHPGVLNYDSTTDTNIIGARYYALRLHDISTAFAAVFGGTMGTKVKIVVAWQSGGNGLYTFDIIMKYLVHAYGNTNTVHALAIAPYKTRDNSGVPGDGVNHIGSNDSIGAIQTQLTNNGNYMTYFANSENIGVMAMHYNCQLLAYESGWEVGGDLGGPAVNIGAAIMDSGMTAVEENYYSHCLNAGFTMMNWYESGVITADPANDKPAYHLSTSYAAIISTGSPRFNALASFASGYTPVRNVVSGSGSVIDARNYSDNTSLLSASYPTLQGDAYNRGPYYGIDGYTPYIINATAAGTFALVGTFTTTASGHTNVEVNGSIVYTNVAIGSGLTNGTVALGNVTLKKGTNYVLLGNGTAQPLITIKQLTFN